MSLRTLVPYRAHSKHPLLAVISLQIFLEILCNSENILTFISYHSAHHFQFRVWGIISFPVLLPVFSQSFR